MLGALLPDPELDVRLTERGLQLLDLLQQLPLARVRTGFPFSARPCLLLSRNSRFQFEIDCSLALPRRAASAIDISPEMTARTSRYLSSTGKQKDVPRIAPFTRSPTLTPLPESVTRDIRHRAVLSRSATVTSSLFHDDSTEVRAPETRGYGSTVHLVVVCASQTLTLVAMSAVTVALPSIQHDLGLSDGEAGWIVSAYAIAMAGFILLGGRIADVVGHRRIFIAGCTISATAALACGSVDSGWLLAAARGVQGLGAALGTPAALSLLLTAYPTGSDRTRALAWWTASGSLGAALGFSLSGVVTDLLSWRVIFLGTIPAYAAVAIAAYRVAHGGRDQASPRSLDAAGGVTVAASLGFLVFALTSAQRRGWTSGSVLGALGVSAALLVLFLVIESRAPAPLMTRAVLRRPGLVGASVVGHVASGLYLGTVLLASFYMQRVLGYSALATGAGFLVQNVSSASSATLARRLVPILGTKRTAAAGMAVAALAAVWLARAPVSGSYVRDVLPALVALGCGLGTTVVAVAIAAYSGIPRPTMGAVAGFLSASQQLGAALGVSVLISIAAARTSALERSGVAHRIAFAKGQELALEVAAGAAVLGVVLCLLLIVDARRVAEGDEPIVQTPT